MECPPLKTHRNRLEKYTSGIIWTELVLPLGTEMSWMTSWGPFWFYFPCFYDHGSLPRLICLGVRPW